MDEALERARKYAIFNSIIFTHILIYMYSGLVPNEDAPDIVANTFLAEVTKEELDKVTMAFLSHRESLYKSFLTHFLSL